MNEQISITMDELKNRFNEYNKLYFGGKLPKCNFGYINCPGTYAYYMKICGKYNTIRFNKHVYWDDKSLKLFLIHEMVHFYVDEFIKPSWYIEYPHGLLFYLKCIQLYIKYGLKVSMLTIPLPPFKKEIVPKTFLQKLKRRMIGCTFK